MQYIVHPANERGTKDIGWLQSKFSFSFSSYQNPAKKSFGLLHTFNDDLVKKVEYAFDNREWLQNITASGYKKVTEGGYDYKSILERILKQIYE